MNEIPSNPLTDPPAKAPKNGLSPLAWVGIGCGGLVLLAIIVLIIGGIFGAKMMKDLGLDLEDDPDKIAAEVVIKMDPAYEKISSDDETGEMTIRDKDGNVMTLKYTDIAESRFDRAEVDIPDSVPTE